MTKKMTPVAPQNISYLGIEYWFDYGLGNDDDDVSTHYLKRKKDVV